MYVVGRLGRWWLSLRWWWMSRTTGRWTRWKRWSPRSGQRLIVLTPDFSILDSKSGSCNQTCILFHTKIFFAMCDALSYELNTLGPLCLWQCLLVRLLSKIQNHLQPIQKFWHKNNSLYLWIEGIVGKLWEHIFLFSFELSLTLRYLWKVFHKYDRETRSSSLNLLLQRWINLQKFPVKISSLILALESLPI